MEDVQGRAIAQTGDCVIIGRAGVRRDLLLEQELSDQARGALPEEGFERRSVERICEEIASGRLGVALFGDEALPGTVL